MFIGADKSSGCWSYIGRCEGCTNGLVGSITDWGAPDTFQLVSLGNGCEPPGTVQHETLHAIGTVFEIPGRPGPKVFSAQVGPEEFFDHTGPEVFSHREGRAWKNFETQSARGNFRTKPAEIRKPKTFKLEKLKIRKPLN